MYGNNFADWTPKLNLCIVLTVERLIFTWWNSDFFDTKPKLSPTRIPPSVPRTSPYHTIQCWVLVGVDNDKDVWVWLFGLVDNVIGRIQHKQNMGERVPVCYDLLFSQIMLWIDTNAFCVEFYLHEVPRLLHCLVISYNKSLYNSPVVAYASMAQ